jgi:hypothetical protein
MLTVFTQLNSMSPIYVGGHCNEYALSTTDVRNIASLAHPNCMEDLRVHRLSPYGHPLQDSSQKGMMFIYGFYIANIFLDLDTATEKGIRE